MDDDESSLVQHSHQIVNENEEKSQLAGRHLVTFADQVPEYQGATHVGKLTRVTHIECYKKLNKMTVQEIDKMLQEDSDTMLEETESCVTKINKVLNSCEGCVIF